MIYKHTDDRHGTRRIELIEFDDNEFFDDFIAEISELAWGDSGAYEEPNGEIVCPREPYCVEETIDRMTMFTHESHAWNTLAMWCGAGNHSISPDDDTDKKRDLREFMDSIIQVVKKQC